MSRPISLYCPSKAQGSLGWLNGLVDWKVATPSSHKVSMVYKLSCARLLASWQHFFCQSLLDMFPSLSTPFSALFKRCASLCLDLEVCQGRTDSAAEKRMNLLSPLQIAQFYPHLFSLALHFCKDPPCDLHCPPGLQGSVTSYLNLCQKSLHFYQCQQCRASSARTFETDFIYYTGYWSILYTYCLTHVIVKIERDLSNIIQNT